MPLTLKPMETIADKWAKRSQAAAPEYTAGVASPRTDWAQATVASADAQAAGVMEAIAAGRFAREVRKAGTAKQQAASMGKGAQRYSPGVTAAKADYNAGFAPFAQVLASLTLPVKGPAGAAGNLERVRAVADALRSKKVSGSS